MNAILSSKVIEYYFFRLILLGAIPIALIFTNDSAWIELLLATEITRLFFLAFFLLHFFPPEGIQKLFLFFCRRNLVHSLYLLGFYNSNRYFCCGFVLYLNFYFCDHVTQKF